MTAPLTRWIVAIFIASLAMGLLLAHAAFAQEAAGSWHGTLSAAGRELRVVITMTPQAGAGFTGAMISADQGPAAIPLTEVKLAGDQLSFVAPKIGGRYQGHWDAVHTAWVGQWSQGLDIPLTLAKGDLPPGPVVHGLDGSWRGALAMPNGAKLRIVVRVATGRYGTIATLDSPDQLAYGFPLKDLIRDGAAVRFAAPSIKGDYAGTLSADGKTLNGSWTQGGRPLPLALSFDGETKIAARPQTPKPPFPYRAEEVSVDSAPGVKLAGTLTLPAGHGPFAAVVMITGSGPQDRDETILGHKPFLVIADDLTRRGIAVLRLDDRGVAKSTGDFGKALTTDFAVDAEAAAAYLRIRPDIDPRKVGLIGHSEGGLVGPMVAAKDPKIAFVVMMAGPGAPLLDVLNAQRLALLPGMGVNEKQAAALNVGMTKAVAAMKDAKTQAEAEARAAAALKAAIPTLPDQVVKTQAQMISSAWFRALLAYDPRPTLRLVKAPTLAINGSKDRQVPAEQNLSAIRAAMKDNPDVTIIELPGLNHLFQTAPTGAAGEYADIEETVAPIALKTMGDWIVAHTAR
ncbi:MAG: alpha/beta fold hydrolase [Phenylobacterium sp.]|nr:alpha/beta fold hydrolase [Phenylobacterium sp.]